jgi:two-component system alkaline phosphatase synthesis response regulator PhoP
MGNGKRILIVEDDEAIAAGLAMNLRLEGYRPEVSVDGQDALERLTGSDFGLVLLDISLPRKTGLELLAELRLAGNHVPVLVLSARQGEYDKVAALRLGADDYVTKPFALAELMARVQALLRRVSIVEARTRIGEDPIEVPAPAPAPAAREGSGRLAFSDVELNPSTRTASRRGVPLKLTHLEFELLMFLVTQPARVFSREELLKRVWGLSSGSRRTVDNFVAQLRGKIEVDPDRPRHFITVRGSGYRFDP